MAEKVLKGITCPACAGELDLREGVKTFNCKYCGTLLLTKGVDGVVKYYVPRKIQRNIAIWFIQRITFKTKDRRRLELSKLHLQN